jgi:predicted lipoprotein with Yx(FWY)xxD motif
MLHRRTAIIVGLGATGAVAVGAGVAAASHGSTRHAVAAGAGAAVVRTESANVGGRTETILVDAHGLPLYYYAPDTATTSRVSGGVAALWPALTAPSTPTAHGLSGRLSVVRDSHGSQVAYNGHLLYTFVQDRSGVVTGQGFQNFFVASPNLGATGNGGMTSYGGGY